MRISKKRVYAVAEQARLNLTEEEVEQLSGELSKLLDFAEKLNELDTENVPPTTHAHGVSAPMRLREDEVRPSWPREQALANAPDTEDGQVKVPAIFEQ